MTALRCLSVIVPAYNEAGNLKNVLEAVKAVPLPKEIVVIDDCSTDGTRELLRAHVDGKATLLETDDQTRLLVLFHEKNAGKGAALRTGIKHATGDLLIVQDADMEYDPGEYPKLVQPILAGQADVVYGSRFANAQYSDHMLLHTFGNKLLTWVSNLFTGLRLTDMETCYKVFRMELIKSIPLESNRFGFEPEVTAKLAKRKVRIVELPITYRGRNYAEGKKITWKDGISALYTIVKNSF